jgi:hypothetical protein
MITARMNSNNSAHGNPHDAKRQQEQPHQRIEHQRQQCQRPADHEQNAPQKKFDHHRLKFNTRGEDK